MSNSSTRVSPREKLLSSQLTRLLFAGASSPRSANDSKSATTQDKIKKEEGEDEAEDYDEYDDSGKPLANKIANRYPKSSIWYMVALALAAIRAGTMFAVVIAYLYLVFRALQLIGVVTEKKALQYIGFGVCSLFNVMLLMAAMAHEGS